MSGVRRNPRRACVRPSVNKTQQIHHLHEEYHSDHDVQPNRNTSTNKKRPRQTADSDDSDFEQCRPNFLPQEREGRLDDEDDVDDADADDAENFLSAKEISRNQQQVRRKKEKATKAKPVKKKKKKKEEKVPKQQRIDVVNSSKQMLDDLFNIIDGNKKGFIDLNDLRRLSDDHGLDFATAEIVDMIKFWNPSSSSSSCSTLPSSTSPLSNQLLHIDREAFQTIAIDSKFIKS